MSRPRISVVIPTLNESARIARTVHAVRTALPDAELIVVDGGSTDATVAAAQAGADLVRTVQGGRGAQLAAGAREATGAIIVLLHADTTLPPEAETAICSALADPGVAGGAFRIRFEEADARMRFIASAINARSRLFRTATGDQAIFARADVLRELGGVPREPLFEDVRLYRALRRRGRVVLLGAEVTTSARLWLSHGVMRVAATHLLFRALHALGVPPRTLAARYPGRRRVAPPAA